MLKVPEIVCQILFVTVVGLTIYSPDRWHSVRYHAKQFRVPNLDMVN
jgi:hypothetical protein